MGLVNVRNTVRAHLFRERFEVFGAVLIPFLFMAESGYANSWVFGGGRLGLDLNSLMAVGRGFALELFIYVCFRLVRGFLESHKSKWLIIPPVLIGLVAMIVSAGMNLGWMAQSPEMQVAMGAVAQFMPGWMANVFRVGLGLLFPVGVGLFALYDVGHLVETMLQSSHLDDRAMLVHRAEMHRGHYLKSMKRAAGRTSKEYDAITDVDANNMVEAVRRGDLSFGSAEIAKQAARSSVTRIMPGSPVALPPAFAHRQQNSLPPMPPLSPKQPMGSGKQGW